MHEPLHRHRPSHRWSNGDLAAKVGADLGLPPDDEQRWILDSIYGEVADSRPSAFEVAVISPRQNIKTSTLGIAALADLFVFGVERHLWTAHHGDTLKGTFNDFRAWIKSNPEYDDQVNFYEGHQDMSIVHRDTGNVIDFQSRTGKAGRGLTGVKRITLDEALYLEPKHIGAIYPTMLTRPGAQVRIGSSAGLVGSEQLRRIRDRGRTGKDKRLAYVEYGAPVTLCEDPGCQHQPGVAEGCALDDRSLWWAANCALWQGRITEESLQDQRQSMPPAEFMREFLSWWEDPEVLGGVFGESWVECFREPPEGLPVAAYGVAASLNLEFASIVAAYVDGDVVHVKPLHTARGTGWVVDRLVEFAGKAEAPVAVDGVGPAAVLISDMAAAGLGLSVMKTTEVKDACAGVVERARERRLGHAGYPELDAAVKSATKQDSGDRWKWGRKPLRGSRHVPNITPLEAATFAVWLADNPTESFVSAYESHGVLTI